MARFAIDHHLIAAAVGDRVLHREVVGQGRALLVEEGEVETSALVEEALEPGDFSWRARALDELELGGPWAGPETFSYVVPGDDDDDDDSAGDSSDGCEGCGSSFATGATGGWMIGLVALAWRRRR